MAKRIKFTYKARGMSIKEMVEDVNIFAKKTIIIEINKLGRDALAYCRAYIAEHQKNPQSPHDDNNQKRVLSH
jgi:hypothetical protein